MNKGLFLCIEGGDGSGKSTQHELLANRLETEGHSILRMNFPRYGQPSAELVELYLHDEFGDATKLDPRLASLPYAIDRLAATPEIKHTLQEGRIVLTGRFTASNMALQGAKLSTISERLKFFRWLANLEYDIMHIPEPDYHFMLHLPTTIALERVQARHDKGDKKLDSHELNPAYLATSEQAYLDLVETFPDRFGLVECTDEDRPRSAEEIHEEIWSKTQELING